MMDFEKTFDEERAFYKNRIETLCAKLEKNQMHGYYAGNKREALELAKEIVRKNKMGGGDWHR